MALSFCCGLATASLRNPQVLPAAGRIDFIKILARLFAPMMERSFSASENKGLFGEQLCQSEVQFRKQLFGEKLPLCEDGFQGEAILPSMVNLDVVVADIDHPKTRQAAVLVDAFLCDSVGMVIARIDDFRNEPWSASGNRDQHKVRANKRSRNKLHNS